jgi:hypothetical protein
MGTLTPVRDVPGVPPGPERLQARTGLGAGVAGGGRVAVHGDGARLNPSHTQIPANPSAFSKLYSVGDSHRRFWRGFACEMAQGQQLMAPAETPTLAVSRVPGARSQVS